MVPALHHLGTGLSRFSACSQTRFCPRRGCPSQPSAGPQDPQEAWPELFSCFLSPLEEFLKSVLGRFIKSVPAYIGTLALRNRSRSRLGSGIHRLNILTSQLCDINAHTHILVLESNQQKF
jgi:hypothetical protein